MRSLVYAGLAVALLAASLFAWRLAGQADVAAAASAKVACSCVFIGERDLRACRARVDRFDANQKVLKDKYSLFATRTAGEVAPNRPDNIGDDYVVYVSDKNAPDVGNIVGYRDGDDWYDANGNQVSDPGLILSSGLAPWLVNTNLPSNGIKSDQFDADQSFEDYSPQINIMPRIAFSFPISDEALFFAHYDILTQRPPGRIRNSPRDYYLLEDNQGAILNNPDLKSERTTDYELGFKQAISKSSSISISAFYRELKNMIQERKIIGAFPIECLLAAIRATDNLTAGEMIPVLMSAADAFVAGAPQHDDMTLVIVKLL